ncbi:MAG: ParB/RepB/Spo0J family partition protein [Alphaproteobacteria bacterium]
MKYLRTEHVPLTGIEVGQRLRRVDPVKVAEIKGSFLDTGQVTSVAVAERKKGGRHLLLAGGHRYAGAAEIPWETIRADIWQPETDRPELEFRIVEIDENLRRHELTPYDRAIFIGERHAVFEELFPELASRGGDRRSAAFNAEKSKRKDSVLKFTRETAALAGRSDRTVERALRIFRLIPPDVKALIAGTSLTTREGDLYALTRYAPAQQKAIVKAVLAADSATTVKAAAATLDGKRPARRERDAQLQRLQDAWKRAGKPARTAFMEFLGEIGVVDGFEAGQL